MDEIGKIELLCPQFVEAVRRLLDGTKGGPRADVAAVARAMTRLSLLGQDLGEQIRALDVNPLIAGSAGCVAVDALVVPRMVGDASSAPRRGVMDHEEASWISR